MSKVKPMNIFKKISSLFTPGEPKKPPEFAIYIKVKCSRCGEIISGRIDLRNDLTIDYDQSTPGAFYFCRKVLIGENRCYQPVEVQLSFDKNRKITQRQISGGVFIDEG
jgi:hypothetical protein